VPALLPYSKSLLPKHFGRRLCKTRLTKNYGLGEEVVVVLDSVFVSLLGEEVVLIVVFDSVLLEVAGDGFTTVVLVSFFSAGGLTVVSFCSQARSKAAPAMIIMHFFIG
jgi:hypothetical protein